MKVILISCSIAKMYFNIINYSKKLHSKPQNSTYSRLLSSGSDVPVDVKVAANMPGDGSVADPAE